MATIQIIPRRWLSRLRQLIRNDHLILTVLAVIIGAASALGTILIRQSIVYIQTLLLDTAGGSLVVRVASLPWWQTLLVPCLGGLLIGVFIYYAMPGRKPQGIAEIIEASALRGGRMSLRAGVGAAIASAGSIGLVHQWDEKDQRCIWVPH